MKNQFTPGPWKFAFETLHNRFLLRGLTSFGHFVGWSAYGVTTEAEDAANARLIAAAPELLRALELFVAQYQGSIEREDRPEMIAGRAAIQKARGGE
jgi:hypothetical protein